RLGLRSSSAPAPPGPARLGPDPGSAPSNSVNAASIASPRKAPTAAALIATRVPKFLRCLYEILHVEDPTILSWSKDGTNFQIHDTKRLEEFVLPKYFKHGKFASFQRQLNNFGFRKWTKTQSNVCTFSHYYFVKRHPEQLVELIIQQNEQNQHRPNTHKPYKMPPPSETNGAGKRKRDTPPGLPLAKAPKKEGQTSLTGWLDTKDVDTVCFVGKPGQAFENNQSEDAAASTQSPLIKQEEPAFDLDVEPWGLMIDVMPLQWSMDNKTAVGGDSPTTISAPIEPVFNFELGDLLLPTSSVTSQQSIDEERLIDLRMLNEYFASTSGHDNATNEPEFGRAQAHGWENEFFSKNDMDMYAQDPELWIN
ncbi:TPA: hypothetical protein N0F65_011911, partial [Lagenidium giganteum]